MLTRSKWSTTAVQVLSIVSIVGIVGNAVAVGCDLYMAESTIRNAGLGIFSAIERNPGDTVGHGDICIPILDLNNYHKKVWNPFNDYVWAGEVMGMKLEIESGDREALCPVGRKMFGVKLIESFSLFIFALMRHAKHTVGFGLCNQLQLGFDQRCESKSNIRRRPSPSIFASGSWCDHTLPQWHNGSDENNPCRWRAV